ncbi:MAG: hypothetical protein WC365_08935 [Candidatus Babeliales bacterium]|jgi:phosphoribosylformylglycinamidine (FGAM) synthase-like amidotransferase family enzyme
MGTRSLTNLYTENGKELLVTIYRQFDGYPEGHGKQLQEIINNRRVVNGFSDKDREKKSFNGAGCLAAQLIHELKDDIGNIYINTPTPEFVCAEGFMDIEYGYKLYPRDGIVWMEIYDLHGKKPKQLFSGYIKAFGKKDTD